MRLRTNDGTEDVNPVNGVTVAPLTAVFSFAQDNPGHPDAEWTAACSIGNYSFAPQADPANGLWAIPIQAKAFLRVPSLSTWGKGLLLTVVASLGVMLVLRSRRPITA